MRTGDGTVKKLIFILLVVMILPISAFADMSEGIENRFYEASSKAKSFEELCMLVKSKRYTASKIRRTAINVLLKIRKVFINRCPTVCAYLHLMTGAERF